MDLQEETIRRIIENRSSTWNELYNKLISSNIPEDDAEQFTEYLYSKSNGPSGIYVPAAVKKACNLKNLSIDNHYSKRSIIDYLDPEVLYTWYEIEFLGIKNNVNNTNKRAKVDLQQYLMKARNIVTDVMGKDYMIKYDRRPRVAWNDLGDHILGQCREYSNGPYIYINNAFKLSEDLVDDYLLNVMTHEFIHSLRSCKEAKHEGEWKRVADLVTQNSQCTIGQYAQHQESIAFHKSLEKLGYTN